MAKINSIVWGIATILLTACGLYYTFKLKFPQFKFKSMFNDPIAYQVNNTIFTLRKKDASKIEVTYEWNKY